MGPDLLPNFEYREVKQKRAILRSTMRVGRYCVCGIVSVTISLLLLRVTKLQSKLGQNSFPRKSPVVQPDTTPTQSQFQRQNDQYLVPSPASTAVKRLLRRLLVLFAGISFSSKWIGDMSKDVLKLNTQLT